MINYYSTPGEIINLINFSEDKSIDLRTTGRYIISQPSTIDGKQYIYERGFDKYEVMEIPKTLLLFLLIEKKEEKKIDMKLDKKNID